MDTKKPKLAGLKGRGSGGHSVTQTKDPQALTATLCAHPYLNFCPWDLSLKLQEPLGVQDRILQIFVPQEGAASWFLGSA